MADTQRTRAALLTLMADNTTGQISAQDFRDFMVTVMQTEFANPEDFWKQPSPKQISTDKTARGWIDYSQIVVSTCSFGVPVALTLSGTWINANVNNSAANAVLGVPMDSYVSGTSTAQILRCGLIYDSALSARFSDFVGRPVFLQSGTAGTVPSVTTTTNSTKIIGYVEVQSDGGTSNIWRFCPTDWSVKGS